MSLLSKLAWVPGADVVICWDSGRVREWSEIRPPFLLSELAKGQRLLLGRVEGRRSGIGLLQPRPEIAMREEIHP